MFEFNLSVCSRTNVNQNAKCTCMIKWMSSTCVTSRGCHWTGACDMSDIALLFVFSRVKVKWAWPWSMRLTAATATSTVPSITTMRKKSVRLWLRRLRTEPSPEPICSSPPRHVQNDVTNVCVLVRVRLYNWYPASESSCIRTHSLKLLVANLLLLCLQLSPRYNAPERVEDGCRASLKKLQLKYVDLYLIHWPVAMKVCYHILYLIHWPVAMNLDYAIANLQYTSSILSLGYSIHPVIRISRLGPWSITMALRFHVTSFVHWTIKFYCLLQ